MPITAVGSLAQLASDENEVSGDRDAIDPWWAYSSAGGGEEPYPIDGFRWNQLFPYQLLVVRRAGSGAYTPEPGWKFTLPFPPDSLSVDTPFAVEVRSTLGGGVIEEHGGAPFRMISFSGTTGVQPLTPNGALTNALSDIRMVIPGGVTQAENVVDAALRFAPANNLMDPLQAGSSVRGSVGRGSGYYQIRLLQLFLERYATIKTTAAGHDLRLAFAMWKDQSVYLVTPQSMNVSKTASSGPLKYSYRIGLKAWRRVHFTTSPSFNLVELITVPKSIMGAILEPMIAARDTLVRLRGVVNGVRNDADLILLEPARELVLLAKATTGATVTLADLPFRTQLDAASAVRSLAASSDAVLREVFDRQDLQRGKTAPESGALDKSSPARRAFDDPLSLYTQFSGIAARTLKLPAKSKEEIAAEVSRVKRLQRVDFEAKQKLIKGLSYDFADSVGLGSDVFNEGLGRVGRSPVRTADDDDFEALAAMNDMITLMDRLLLANEDRSADLSALDYVAGLARSSGIAFTTPASKFSVPFPYGSSLEALAQTYLGDSGRWHEIASINGLRAPYIDEVGTKTYFVTNGAGNTAVVADASGLYIGQPVTIGSNNISLSRRRVVGLWKMPTGQWQVSFSGESDLSGFTSSAEAYLHAYLPDTVNSSQQLFIPSTNSVDPELINRGIPGVQSFQTVLERGGVDMALDSTGDIIVTPDGDTPWSVGLANIVQRIQTTARTVRGSMLKHPEFGLSVPVGSSTADVDAKQLLEQTQAAFARDPDFSGVFFASVDKSGPVVRQVVHVGVAGVDQLVPVGLILTR